MADIIIISVGVLCFLAAVGIVSMDVIMRRWDEKDKELRKSKRSDENK